MARTPAIAPQDPTGTAQARDAGVEADGQAPDRRRQPRVVVLAWAKPTGRGTDIATALGGVPVSIYPLPDRRLILLRYALSLVATVGTALRRRPDVAVVQNPPIFPALVFLAWKRLSGARLILDCHPTGFGAKDNAQGRRMLSVTKWVARRSDGVLVTTGDWADVVTQWGGRPLVVHEAPPANVRGAVAKPSPDGSQPFDVLFACTFAQDEPVAEVMDAARALPGIHFTVTGDPDRARPGDLADLPGNVELTGWVDQARYLELLERSDAVLALTTEPTSVMRAAYEAVYGLRPLIATDWPTTAELFPSAALVDNSAGSIAAAIGRIAQSPVDHETLSATADSALERWTAQEQALRSICDLPLDAPRRSR